MIQKWIDRQEITYTSFPFLESDLKRVEGQLCPEIKGHAEVTEIVQHLFGSVPKLVRPTLTLMSAYVALESQSPVPQRVIEATTALEFIHVGTLCHDDVMDNADTRRGRSSVGAQWGISNAILAGDFLLASGAEIASNLGAAESIVIASTLRKLCTGQMIEILDKYNVNRTETSYIEAIGGKTATLLSASCEMGALEAGAAPETVKMLADFGYHFGIAFQINDDILDLTANSKSLGKPAGKDIVEGVYTLPVIHAIRNGILLKSYLDKEAAPANIEEICSIISSSDAIEYSREVALDHMNRAKESVYSVCYDERAQSLIDFAEGMISKIV